MNWFLKTWDETEWGNSLFFGETDFTIGFADPMFLIQCTIFVEL